MVVLSEYCKLQSLQVFYEVSGCGRNKDKTSSRGERNIYIMYEPSCKTGINVFFCAKASKTIP